MKIRRTALLVATAAALTLTGCGETEDPTPSASDTRAQGDRTKDSQPDESTEPTDEEDEPEESVTVPVYFVGDTPQGPRLFREFRQVGADNPLEEAAALLTAGDTLDPDYRTLFPGGAFESVYEEGDFLVARVPDDGWQTLPAGMSRPEAKLAIQSLVYTLQGAAQSRKPVLVGIDTSDWVPLFGEFRSNGFLHAPPLEVLGLVSVTTPEQDSSVSGSFTAGGVASSFEATVPWEVRQDGDVVLEGFATAEGWTDKLYPWESEVDVSSLPPGDYTFVAMTSDPSGGEGGGPTEDSKDFTIE
jgi:hypothetical protein